MQKMSQGQLASIAIGVVVLILIIVAVAKNTSSNTPTNTNASPTVETPTSTPTSNPVTNTNQQAKKTTSKLAPANPAYEDTVKKYTGYRFQINDSCQVSPTQATFANDTAVMFDNRSPIDRILTLGTQKFTVKAKGWITMKLTSKTLPNTINVNCGSAYNVAKIILQ